MERKYISCQLVEEIFMDGLGPLDLESVKAPKKVGRERDGRVCVCGHSAKNHGALAREYFDTPLEEVPKGSVACSAGRHQCACTEFYPVLETADVRRFMSKTIGPGADHALARGVSNALTAGVSITWRENLPCGKCKAVGVRLLPVAIRLGPNGPRIALETTEHNYLLCGTCRSELTTEVRQSDLASVSAPEPKM